MNMRTGLVVVLGIWLQQCGGDPEAFRYTGILEGTAINVPALTGGQIVAVLVEEGQAVERGDTLAVIDTTELALQRRQVQARLRELQVQRDMARANVQRSASDLSYLQQKYDRLALLVEKQTAPQQNLDDLANQLQRARIALKTARQNLAQLDALQEQLVAQIELIDKKVRDAVITAPASGVVASRFYEAGEAVPPLSPVVELLDLRTMSIKIYVSAATLPQIRLDQQVTLYVNGLEGGLPARVSWIASKAEFTPKTILTPETRTSLVYAVKVTVSNPDGRLKHGMPAEVEL